MVWSIRTVAVEWCAMHRSVAKSLQRQLNQIRPLKHEEERFLLEVRSMVEQRLMREAYQKCTITSYLIQPKYHIATKFSETSHFVPRAGLINIFRRWTCRLILSLTLTLKNPFLSDHKPTKLDTQNLPLSASRLSITK